MSKLWKCYNHAGEGKLPTHDFIAEHPVCPKCGLDGRKAEYKGTVVARTLIHFEEPHPVVKNRGCGKRTCDGKPVLPKPENVQFTGEPTVVNCPACRKAETWLAAMADRGEPVVAASVDFAVSPDKYPEKEG